MSHHDLLTKHVTFFNRTLKVPDWRRGEVTATRGERKAAEVFIAPYCGDGRWIPVTDLKEHEVKSA